MPLEWLFHGHYAQSRSYKWFAYVFGRWGQYFCSSSALSHNVRFLGSVAVALALGGGGGSWRQSDASGGSAESHRCLGQV